MLTVAPPSVPLFRSFGLLPQASSEGFLVFLYSWEGCIVIFFDYTFFSEYLVEVHFFELRPPSGGSPTEKTNGGKHHRKVLRPVSLAGSQCKRMNPRGYRRKRLRLNLMMTAPPTLGILESLNPTDEALRKGRNTKNKYTRVPHSCLCLANWRLL